MALPLNPKAPEFYPKTRAQEPNFPSRSTFSVKPGKLRQPRCLPPRLLKQKVWVHKNRNFLPRKPLPPPKESELKSLPSPQEDTFKSLFGDKTSVMIRNVPNIFGSVFNFKILFCNVYLCYCERLKAFSFLFLFLFWKTKGSSEDFGQSLSKREQSSTTNSFFL